jgi:ABC-type antimicrobial peptide transport system permease subunit
VGVAKDVNVQSLSTTDTSYMYTPSIAATQAELRLLMRSPLDPLSLATSVQALVTKLDPTLMVRVAPLEENLELWRRLSRLVVSLSSSLGGLALALGCIGIYGVISFVVSRRIREIGIRLALGAPKRAVLGLILRRSMKPVLIGALVGVVMCYGVSQLLHSLLFGISPVDPLALAAGTFVVLALTFAAALIPARRATRVDPMTTLRYE